MTESVSVEADGAAAADVLVRAGHDGHRRADRSAAAERPQFRQPDAHRPRRASRHPGRQHRRRRQPRVARLGLVLGQRAARARQQLHARRRRQQRNLAADGRHLPERRRARRVQDADLDLLGRVRPLARRRRQPADQVRHEQAPRQRLRVPPRRRVRREQLLQQPRRPRQAGLQAEPVRRHVRRRACSRTRRSSSATTRGIAKTQGQTFLSTVPTLAMRAGNFCGAQSRHLRSDDGPAVSRQRHSRRPHRHGREEHPDAALSGAEHRRHALRRTGRRSTTT